MASSPPAIMLGLMDVPADIEEFFHHWYRTEHIPERLAVPGFVGARRYRTVRGPAGFVTLYELESVAALEHPDYVKLSKSPSGGTKRVTSRWSNVTRGIYEQIWPENATAAPAPEGTGALLLAGLSVPPEREEEFHAWYNTEHMPYLGAVSGVLRARRFAPVDGSRKYLAVYELVSPDVVQSEEWSKAANTPWSNWQRSKPREGWLSLLATAVH